MRMLTELLKEIPFDWLNYDQDIDISPNHNISEIEDNEKTTQIPFDK